MTDILKYLRAADIFAVLDPDELENLSRDPVVTKLAPGQAAVTQGDNGCSLFIIISGQMSAVITDAGSAVHVRDLSCPSGESSLAVMW